MTTTIEELEQKLDDFKVHAGIVGRAQKESADRMMDVLKEAADKILASGKASDAQKEYIKRLSTHADTVEDRCSMMEKLVGLNETNIGLLQIKTDALVDTAALHLERIKILEVNDDDNG